jgi:hypothetical protein
MDGWRRVVVSIIYLPTSKPRRDVGYAPKIDLPTTPKISNVFQHAQKILKHHRNTLNTLKLTNLVLILRNCGIIVVRYIWAVTPLGRYPTRAARSEAWGLEAAPPETNEGRKGSLAPPYRAAVEGPMCRN